MKQVRLIVDEKERFVGDKEKSISAILKYIYTPKYQCLYIIQYIYYTHNIYVYITQDLSTSDFYDYCAVQYTRMHNTNISA